MKNTFITIFALASLFLKAQINKVATMEPILTDGYYVSLKGDTIKGKVQVNPPSNDEFYQQFHFKDMRSKKSKIYTVQRAKAYGFDDKNFVMVNLRGRKVFMERLTTGRLRFYELKFREKASKDSELQSAYFIKDTQAENVDTELKELKKITPKFYKKNLKPFMKDQPAIWNSLDKYNFNEQSIISAVNQFNVYYPPTIN